MVGVGCGENGKKDRGCCGWCCCCGGGSGEDARRFSALTAAFVRGGECGCGGCGRRASKGNGGAKYGEEEEEEEAEEPASPRMRFRVPPLNMALMSSQA